MNKEAAGQERERERKVLFHVDSSLNTNREKEKTEIESMRSVSSEKRVEQTDNSYQNGNNLKVCLERMKLMCKCALVGYCVRAGARFCPYVSV